MLYIICGVSSYVGSAGRYNSLHTYHNRSSLSKDLINTISNLRKYNNTIISKLFALAGTIVSTASLFFFKNNALNCS